MSTGLRLDLNDYERMIACGAFDRIDRRIEFIAGELREMSPVCPIHDDYIEFLISWSAPYVASELLKTRCQMGIQVGDSVPEPDIAWLLPQRLANQRPCVKDILLLIEVSDSSLQYDLGEKATLYAAGGIPEYWVIDVNSKRLHRHREPSPTGFQNVDTFEAGGKVAPLCHPDATLALGEMFLG